MVNRALDLFGPLPAQADDGDASSTPLGARQADPFPPAPAVDDFGGFHSAFRVRVAPGLDNQLPAISRHAHATSAQNDIHMIENEERRARILEGRARRRALVRHQDLQIAAARREVDRLHARVGESVEVSEALAAAWPMLPAAGGGLALIMQITKDPKSRQAWLFGSACVLSGAAVAVGQQEVRRRRRAAADAAADRVERLEYQRAVSVGMLEDSEIWRRS